MNEPKVYMAPDDNVCRVTVQTKANSGVVHLSTRETHMYLNEQEAALMLEGLKAWRGDTSPIVTAPIPMLLWCPECGLRHIDEGEFATKLHHTHACQGCGHVWRPAIVPTVGVRFLPGFKNGAVT